MATRHLVESDIPQVVDLYWNYMLSRKGSAPAALHPFFRELYFANPWDNGSSPSLVYEKDGRVLGFLGISARRMSVNGKPIRAAFGGNFVVHPEARSGMATPRMLEALFAANHDLLLSDSANERTRSVLTRRDFHILPALNLHWARPLRPSQYAAYFASRPLGPLAAGLQMAAKPFCALADGFARRLNGPFRQNQSRLQGKELDVETLAQCLATFRSSYSLWPDQDARSLKWTLSFMDRRRKRGQLRKIAVHEESGRTVGWYIYYAKRGAIGEVVQVGGEPKQFREILRHLFHDAWEQGVIALHGIADFREMAAHSDEGCFFSCRGGWVMARARSPEILAILDRGNGLLTRLDGEWCLDPGE